MKIFTVIFCLFLSVHAFSQSVASKNTAELSMRDASAHPTKSLVVLDGVIYNGSLDSIKLDSILSVDVLRGINATSIYGSRAQKGVIVIKTKTDTQSKALPPIRCMASLTTTNDPLYIVNDIVYKGKLENIDVNSIKTVDILKGKQATALYGTSGSNGVIIIKLKPGAKVDSLKQN